MMSFWISENDTSIIPVSQKSINGHETYRANVTSFNFKH